MSCNYHVNKATKGLKTSYLLLHGKSTTSILFFLLLKRLKTPIRVKFRHTCRIMHMRVLRHFVSLLMNTDGGTRAPSEGQRVRV